MKGGELAYDRIDVTAIPPLPRGARLALYGAGEGAVQLLEWLANNAPGCLVLGVADDEPALHGRSLHGLPILPAEALLHMPLDLVVVTTAAGRDAAAGRLAALGWREGAGFVLAGVGRPYGA